MGISVINKILNYGRRSTTYMDSGYIACELQTFKLELTVGLDLLAIIHSANLKCKKTHSTIN